MLEAGGLVVSVGAVGLPLSRGFALRQDFWAVSVRHVWQRHFYDFVVFTEKRVEKLRYMHRNPVQRGLVLKPEDWLWSSFRHYAYGERGPVMVNETRKAELRIRKIS
jgi:hypothetical protein